MLIGEQSFFAALVLLACTVVHIVATASFRWPCNFEGLMGARADAVTALVAGDRIDGFCCARCVGAFWGL